LLHQKEDSVFDYGLPLFRGKPADVPRTTFYGFSDDRLQEYTTTFATATFDHRFSSDLSIRNTFRYGDYERRYRTHLFGDVTDTGRTSTVARNQHLRLGTQENFYNQTDLVWKTSLAGIRGFLGQNSAGRISISARKILLTSRRSPSSIRCEPGRLDLAEQMILREHSTHI
jgi:catecholate siderophore receptor